MVTEEAGDDAGPAARPYVASIVPLLPAVSASHSAPEEGAMGCDCDSCAHNPRMAIPVKARVEAHVYAPRIHVPVCSNRVTGCMEKDA